MASSTPPPTNFYPRPPRGGRPTASRYLLLAATFLSTPSARRATAPWYGSLGADGLFLSTPSARRATASSDFSTPKTRDFYPRPPRGGRPHSIANICKAAQFLSTPSARRATLKPCPFCGGSANFYPRPPRGGRPGIHIHRRSPPNHFYPRPPRGGRRRCCCTSTSCLLNFYPRPPRGGRREAGPPW